MLSSACLYELQFQDQREMYLYTWEEVGKQQTKKPEIIPNVPENTAVTRSLCSSEHLRFFLTIREEFKFYFRFF